MKNLKKIIAIVLVCLMAFSVLQLNASAANSAVDAIQSSVALLEQAADSGISIAAILVGVLYACIPILIVIDLVAYLVSGNTIIGGALLGMLG